MSANVVNAVEILKENNVNVSVLILNKIKPLPIEVLDIAKKHNMVFFYEESVKSGSIGESFADNLLNTGFKNRYMHVAVDDEFVPHASIQALMKKYKLDTESIVKNVMEILNG